MISMLWLAVALLLCSVPQLRAAASNTPPVLGGAKLLLEAVDEAQIVRGNILQQLVPARPIPNVDVEVSALVPALLANGTWADIDYADGSRSWWFAAEHLRRCLLMASAFSSSHSQHHAAPAVRAVSDRAFEWWLNTDPQNQWWWMQIGVPRILCKYLLMLPSPRLYELATPLLERTPLSILMKWTGCNRVWVASVHVLRGAIELNSTRLARAFEVAHSTLHLNPQSGDGIQTDGSFHQHGTQLYSGWGCECSNHLSLMLGVRTACALLANPRAVATRRWCDLHDQRARAGELRARNDQLDYSGHAI
jgi:chondroitin AC lyase